MAKTLLTLWVCVLITCIGAQECIVSKYDICASTFTKDVAAAGSNLKRFCDAVNKVVTCSKDAHCSEYTKTALDVAYKYFPGGESPCSSSALTYSLALVMSMVLLQLAKRI